MSVAGTHQWEQFGAHMKDFAGTVTTYFNELLAGRFTRAEALKLTVAFQNSMLVMARQQKKGDK